MKKKQKAFLQDDFESAILVVTSFLLLHIGKTMIQKKSWVVANQ